MGRPIIHKTPEEVKKDYDLLRDEIDIVLVNLMNIETNSPVLKDGKLDFQSARAAEKEIARKMRVRLTEVIEKMDTLP